MRQPPIGRIQKISLAGMITFTGGHESQLDRDGISGQTSRRSRSTLAETARSERRKLRPRLESNLPERRLKAAKKAGSGRSKPEEDEPIVMSAEAMATGPREDGRQGPLRLRGPTGATIPPWRQTSFFGIKAAGEAFRLRRRLLGQHDRRGPARPGQVRAAAEHQRLAVAPALQGDLLQRPSGADARRTSQAGRLPVEGAALALAAPGRSPKARPTPAARSRWPWR